MKLHCIPILSALFTSLVCFSNPATKISDNSPSSGIVIRWNDCEQTIDGFGIAQAGWAKELFAFKNRKQVMDKMFGNDGLRLNILRGEIFPHYWENKEDKDFNLNDDINIELCDSDFNNKSDDLLRRGQLWLTLEAKNKYHINKLVFSTWSAPAWMKSNGKVSNGNRSVIRISLIILQLFTKLTNPKELHLMPYHPQTSLVMPPPGILLYGQQTKWGNLSLPILVPPFRKKIFLQKSYLERILYGQ